MKKIISLFAAAVLSGAVLTGCGGTKEIPEPDRSPSTLAPVDSLSTGNSYQGIKPTVEATEATFRSADGICTIEKKKSYYDVTLDYSCGDYKKIGAAYAEAILAAYPDYTDIMEPYIYENIHAAFPNMTDDYSAVSKRVDDLKSAIEKDYQLELDGFAEKISGGERGFSADKKLSYDEACLLQMVPDTLRGTACSSFSVNGNKTSTGERMTARLLEWELGSSNQICMGHAVLHAKNGEKSFTGITFLGMFSIITAVNDNGVMAAIHDVGSIEQAPYVSEGKTSYTYGIRYALENFDTAREAGEYLTANATNYTWNCNILLSDKDDVFCAELAVEETAGCPNLRDSSTKLNNGVDWNDPDSFCIVNTFVSEGNCDQMTDFIANIARWEKYKKVFDSEKGITPEHFKELLTTEKLTNEFVTFRSKAVIHLVIVDYSDGSINAALAGVDGVAETPEFLDLGKY